MNRFVIFVSLFSILFCASICLDFCFVQTMDNVFNIGHLIYIQRCGEVWTYDPRIKNGRGGFFRDYMWFAFARRHFAQNIPRGLGVVYDDKLFHFTAFSFQELVCDDVYADIERDCRSSAKAWNGLTVLADNWTALSLRFESHIVWTNDSSNPLALPYKQDYREERRHPFWPNLSKLVPDYYFMGSAGIRSALFDKNDFRLYIGLYLFLTLFSYGVLRIFSKPGLESPIPEKYYCITHMDVREMLFDLRKWPSVLGNQTVYKWAQPYCYIGNLVGMFSYNGQSYIVGRVLLNSQEYEYEDQVYSMRGVGNSPVDIIEEVVIVNSI